MEQNEALLKSSFSCNSLILYGNYEAAQEEHHIAPSFVGVFHQPSDNYRTIEGCPSGGGGSMMCWSPKERLRVSL